MESTILNRSLLSFLVRTSHFARLIGLIQVRDEVADVIDHAFLKAGRPPLSIKLDKFKIYGYLRHSIFLKTIAEGNYEPFSRELFLRHLKPGTIVIDGGSHIGLYSLLASRALGNRGRVFAFEPDPYNFYALTFNIGRNNYNNVTLGQKALFNSVGNLRFHQSKSTLSGSLVDRKDKERYGEIMVQATTLDKELENLEIDSIFIKLDLEGAEPLALQGMLDVLHRVSFTVMLIEVNPVALCSAGFKPAHLISELKQIGFRIHYVDEEQKRLVSPATGATIQKGNLYCTKND